MPTNTSKTINIGRNFDLITDSELKNFKLLKFKMKWIKSKIRIFQLIAKIILRNKAWTKSDTVWQDIIKSNTISFLSKKIKVFQWLSKSKILSFMTNVNPSNWTETKPGIFSLDIFKSDIIFHWSQYTKIFNDSCNWNFWISFQKWEQTSKAK